MKITDILNNKKDKSSKKSKSYTLQKTKFTVADMNQSKKDSGRSSVSKTGGAAKDPNVPKEKQPKLDINDPNFWEKLLPFDGYNPKQLNKKFKSKRNEILKNKESQSKFLKEISKCIDDILEAKSTNPSLEIDEELYELLKKINKTKQFEHKYRTKATVLLEKLLTFNDYRIMDGEDGSRLQRKAKQKPKDYKEKTSINGRRRKKADSKATQSQPADDDDDDDDMQSDSQDEEAEKPVSDHDGSDAVNAGKKSPTTGGPGKNDKLEKKLAKKVSKAAAASTTVKMNNAEKQKKKGGQRESSLEEKESRKSKAAEGADASDHDSLKSKDEEKRLSSKGGDKKGAKKRQKLS